MPLLGQNQEKKALKFMLFLKKIMFCCMDSVFLSFESRIPLKKDLNPQKFNGQNNGRI